MASKSRKVLDQAKKVKTPLLMIHAVSPYSTFLLKALYHTFHKINSDSMSGYWKLISRKLFLTSILFVYIILQRMCTRKRLLISAEYFKLHLHTAILSAYFLYLVSYRKSSFKPAGGGLFNFRHSRGGLTHKIK